jgi:hypothetical protein
MVAVKQVLVRKEVRGRINVRAMSLRQSRLWQPTDDPLCVSDCLLTRR